MMWLKLVFLLLSLITVILTDAIPASEVKIPDESEFKDFSKDLIDKFVHLHWLYQRGWWTGVSGKNQNRLKLQESPESKIYFQDWSRFKIIDCNDGFVCIKSVWAEDKYIQFKTTFTSITYSGYPQNKADFRWNIECTNDQFEICRIKNARFDWYLCNHRIYFDGQSQAAGDMSDPREKLDEECLYEIKAPEAHKSMEVVDRLINKTPQKVTKTYKIKEGVKTTTGSKDKFTAGLAAEISGGYAGMDFSVSASVEKALETSIAKEQATELEMTTTVPVSPYSILEVKQMVGTYGPFTIKTSQTALICYDSYTNERCDARDERKRLEKEQKKMKEKEKKTEKTE